MFGNDIASEQVNFVAGPGTMTDQFQQSVKDLSCSNVSIEITRDLRGEIIHQSQLPLSIQSGQSYNLASLSTSVKIVLVDHKTLPEFAGGSLSRVLSLMCGESNSEALQAYDARVAAFYCVSAEKEVRLAQLRFLCKQYRAHIEAMAWRLAGQRLLGKRCCSLAGLIHELDAIRQQRSRPQQIALRTGSGWQYVDWQVIRYIEAAGDYMCVYTHDETLVVRSTMTELSQRLPPAFTRINRSLMVNAQFVKRLIQLNARVCYVELMDGSRLKVSRRLMPKCIRVLNSPSTT